jgi:hypothetical protein
MHRIVFFGKSKRRTRTTAHLVRAFKEKGNHVLWLNPHKIRRIKKKNTNQFILNKINKINPDFVFITSKDIPHTSTGSQGSQNKEYHQLHVL